LLEDFGGKAEEEKAGWLGSAWLSFEPSAIPRRMIQCVLFRNVIVKDVGESLRGQKWEVLPGRKLFLISLWNAFFGGYTERYRLDIGSPRDI